MKPNTKKFLAKILVLCLIVSLVPAVALRVGTAPANAAYAADVDVQDPSTSGGKTTVEVDVKRAMDIVGSALALVLLSPLMLVCAVGVKLSSPGPVIFRQERVGRDKKPFYMYKFRSIAAILGISLRSVSRVLRDAQHRLCRAW